MHRLIHRITYGDGEGVLAVVGGLGRVRSALPVGLVLDGPMTRSSVTR